VAPVAVTPSRAALAAVHSPLRVPAGTSSMSMSSRSTGGAMPTKTAPGRGSDAARIAAVTAGISQAMGAISLSGGAAAVRKPDAAPVGSGTRAAAALSASASASSSSPEALAGAVATLQAQVAGLSSTVEKLSSQNKKLKARNAALRSQRSDGEVLLLSCIEETKKEVHRRKQRAAQEAGASDPAAATSASAASLSASHAGAGNGGVVSLGHLESEITGDHKLQAAVAAARATRVSEGDFAATDKRALLAKLLQDDSFLERLPAILFGGGQ
jgi:hypothetical protein